MKKEKRASYSDKIRLLDIECERPYDWNTSDATHIRVCMPVHYENHLEMLCRGFSFVDRTVDVSINLLQSKVDYSALARLEPVVTTQHREEVRAIAQQSFPRDRRFHLRPSLDQELADTVISGWVDELTSWYWMEHRGEAIGFLALKGDEMRKFIHLAAVREKYRASGAAMSLYAAAARDCKSAGAQFMNGRISTENTAVMNLYAFLGGSFSKPMNVYLKEV